VVRELISELFFNTSLGNGFYSDLSSGTFAVLLVFIFLSYLLIKFAEYIKVEFLFGLGLLLSSITTINVLRYKPYGGDAKIYCDLTALSNSSNLSIYDVEYKYTFNYPPIFKQLLDFLCDLGYQSNYYFFLLPGLCLFLLILRNENKNIFLNSLYLYGAFIALRWVLKTGNFVMLELLFLILFVWHYKKKSHFSYLFLILFGIQRIWFLLLVPILFYLDNTNIAKKVKTIISTSLFAILVNIYSLNKFVLSIFDSNSQYNILRESPGHNTPSIYLGLLNILNIDSNIFLLLIYVLASIYILFLILRKYKMSTDIKLITIFTLILLINPYLKPYHFIFIVPCLLLVSDNFLKDKKNIIISIIVPNLFWIIFSNLSSGTSIGYFQLLFIVVFIVNLISLDKEKNEID
tara:strand:+ start:377 stop:1591 length:1215 start_codon:yes stop_codon:yes gene_type:complete